MSEKKLFFSYFKHKLIILLYFISLPQDALDLLDQMLTIDPSKRISCEKALQHEFLHNIIPESIEPPQ